jgi:hypothetical protein
MEYGREELRYRAEPLLAGKLLFGVEEARRESAGHFVKVDKERDFAIGVMIIAEVVVREYVGDGERWVGLSEIFFEKGGEYFQVDPKGLVRKRVSVI